eukprot:3629889-Pyramimonas_sp.AAC.1
MKAQEYSRSGPPCCLCWNRGQHLLVPQSRRASTSVSSPDVRILFEVHLVPEVWPRPPSW